MDEAEVPLLRIEKLSVAAGGVALLRRVSASVERGEVLGITGPSGCGKSTLLRTVSGLVDETEGGVLYKGQTRSAYGWPRYRREVVLVGQQPMLFDDTVEANLLRPFSYRSAALKEAPMDEARSLMERLAVGPERLGQSALSLSVGQQLRLCLIRALILEPRVVLLDEPASALDNVRAELVWDLVREKAAQGLSALMVTHDEEQAKRWCDRVMDLREFVVE